MAERVFLKRAYEAPAKSDGTRVLVDRLWPRGISKEALKADHWLKEVAPSTELRKWFDHDPEKWAEMKKRYKAEVSADVDFSSVESTSEMFNPDQPALRSEQQVNEQRQSSLPPQGVPGALSNQPPGPAAAPEQAAGAAAPAGPVAAGQPLVDANGQQIMDPVTGQPMLAPYPADKREQSTRNFELDRSISYTRQQQGRLRRLSVAVVVDDQVRVDPATGESSRVPWTTDDLARFTRLVQDSVGFDASRGDSGAGAGITVLGPAPVGRARPVDLPRVRRHPRASRPPAPQNPPE